MVKSKPRVLLVIPCYNEEKNIQELLEDIRGLEENYDTIVIDDGSNDNTAKVAGRYSPVVRLLRNLGIGGAVQTGIKYAKYNNFDFCVQIDGDGQHPPGEITKLLQAHEQKPCSIMIGSRYSGYDTFRSTWMRRSGGKVIAWALNTLFAQCAITDPTSGMRLMDRKAIEFFAERYPHDFPEPISLAWAFGVGLSVGEIPVRMHARKHGNSSIAGLKSMVYMLRVLGYILLTRLVCISPKNRV